MALFLASISCMSTFFNVNWTPGYCPVIPLNMFASLLFIHLNTCSTNTDTLLSHVVLAGGNMEQKGGKTRDVKLISSQK